MCADISELNFYPSVIEPKRFNACYSSHVAMLYLSFHSTFSNKRNGGGKLSNFLCKFALVPLHRGLGTWQWPVAYVQNSTYDVDLIHSTYVNK